MSTRDHLVRLGAVARRDLRSERSYQFRYVLWLFELAVTAVVVFHVGKLITDTPALQVYGGRYFDFAMVGLAMMSVARLGVGTFSANIMSEQSAGTLEILLVSPIRLWVFLAGSFVVPLLLTAVDLVMYFGVGIGALGAGLTVQGLALSVPIVALTLATFCAFGIFGAALGVLVKRGDPVSGPLLQVTSIMSGALFPISVFPGPIRALARAFPAFYGINGVREALLAGSGAASVWPEVAILALFVAVLLPLSVVTFGRAIGVAQRTGVLASY